MSPAVAEQPERVAPSGVPGEIVHLDDLRPSPLNPRKRFEKGSMADLEANIQKHGVIVPLLVRRHFEGTGSASWVGEVIDGERRYRAARAAGAEFVPCVFRDELSDGEVIEIQLLSAIQRQDLTPLEEAAGFRALIDSNPSLYSAAYIADRVGRSERWVWDRMQLLDLVPLAKQLLEADLILVGHAELLAKLKPEDQLRALGEQKYGDGYIGSGLFEPTASRLGFDEPTDDEDDHDADDTDPVAAYRAYKAKTVKELEAWIARHVRFDVQHMAATAPLDFGPVFDRVQEALTKPGRGKKVVPITFEYTVHPDAKSDERTYGQNAWKRADGSNLIDAPTCEHAVLGTVVAGRRYGHAFDVCVAKDRCEVHWKDEIKAKQKNDELRAKGQGSKAAQNEVVDRAKEERQRAEREQQRKEWEKLEALLDAEAINQVKKVKVLTPAHAKFIGDADLYRLSDDAGEHLGAKWYLQPAAALLVVAVMGRQAFDVDQFDKYIARVVKPLGLTRAPFDAIVASLDPKKPAPAPAKKSATKASAKAKAGKKAKKR